MEAMDIDTKEDKEIEIIAIKPAPSALIDGKSKEELAESKKDEGNKYYKQKQYRDAIKQYTGAVDLCPGVASYYANRAACYINLREYKLALEDAQKSVNLEPKNAKYHVRVGKCHLHMGNADAAIRCFEVVKKLDPKNPALQSEFETAKAFKKHIDEAKKYMSAGKDYRSALFNIERALQICPDCVQFKVMRAECLTLLGRHSESQNIVTDILRSDNFNVEAYYIRGVTLYYQDLVDKAFTHFQQALKLNPDHVKSKEFYKKAKLLVKKKEEGNALFKESKLQEAYNVYTEALQIDPMNVAINSKIYFNRAIVNNKLCKLQDAIKDCSTAVELDENYIKAYLKRAQLYMDSEMYEEATRDYELVYKKEKTREHKQLLDNAKLELKKSKRKDYYKILGVGKSANEEEIKKAYKKRAMIHHPDRHCNATEEVKKDQEKKFKELGEAYSVLSDSKKRTRYDNGVDLDDSGGMDIDPHNLFQAFFGDSSGGFGGGGFSPFGGNFSTFSSGGPGFHFNSYH